VIRSATIADAPTLCDIYNHYIAATIVTFEEEAIDAAEIAQRMAKVVDAGLPWIVSEVDSQIVGYAYAAPWRVRRAYRYSVETSIYLAQGQIGRGWGADLYRELLAQLGAKGFHLAIGGIALPNEASVCLHEKLGFKKVAHFEEVGFKFGRWIDLGYWQKTLSFINE
jgi:L-amino acid N-acyltransferase YncA